MTMSDRLLGVCGAFAILLATDRLLGVCGAFAILLATVLPAHAEGPGGSAPAAPIKLRSGTFTPALGEAPDVPVGLTISGYAAGQGAITSSSSPGR